jgi:hypothetical protein
MTALRLIIENHPLWKKPQQQDGATTSSSTSAYAVPAPSRKIYMLMGRRYQQWHTIVPRLEDLDMALDGMDSANRSQLFDRLVIAEAHCLGEQPATRWDTYICAVPAALRAHAKPSFDTILRRVERRQAAHPPAATLAPTRPRKNPIPLSLLLLAVTTVATQTVPLILGAAFLWVFETAYQLSWLDRVIPLHQARSIHKARLYLYALCLGLTILPMASHLFLNMLRF